MKSCIVRLAFIIAPVVMWVGAACAVAASPAEHRLHSSMPPLPASPGDYQNMWDTFAVRGPAGEPVAVKAESDSQSRVMGGFDVLPWNGRQLARDAGGAGCC